ncbi:MAG TPA: choice-of-anchor L domain-containing protein, partial [Bacteroidia bacterium]
MRNIISIFGLLYLCGLSEVSFSQLQVTPNNNATQLAQSLAGNGVTISGATMNCPSLGNNAAGTFNGTFSNIGISSGVLLTTGSVINAVGPNNTPMAYTDNQVTFSDPDIVAIEPSAIHDVCILEFDAVPTCNSMAFTFAFGSEEYNEYVPSPTDTTGVNDCFGIFVTGVNPSGPAYSGYNMALIPATTTPVSIFNVNNGYDSLCPSTGPCKNCAYFIDNCNGPSIQYDGFTKPITVTLSVVPCNSYHYKLAIADAYDGEYDSGVFFATQSLVCATSLTVTATTTSATCNGNNGTATVTGIIGGQAPYSYLWSTVPVQNTSTATGLSAGNYTVTVADVNGCLQGTQTVTISQPPTINVTVSSSTNVSCFGGHNGSAIASCSGGTGTLTYTWNTIPVQIGSTASNLIAGNYTVTIKDSTGCTASQSVTINQPSDITLTSNSTPSSCGVQNGSASVSGSGGIAPLTYLWLISPVQLTPTATGIGAGTYTVIVSDANGCTKSQKITVGGG